LRDLAGRDAAQSCVAQHAQPHLRQVFVCGACKSARHQPISRRFEYLRLCRGRCASAGQQRHEPINVNILAVSKGIVRRCISKERRQGLVCHPTIDIQVLLDRNGLAAFGCLVRVGFWCPAPSLTRLRSVVNVEANRRRTPAAIEEFEFPRYPFRMHRIIFRQKN